jgi:hypothetical protein
MGLQAERIARSVHEIYILATRPFHSPGGMTEFPALTGQLASNLQVVLRPGWRPISFSFVSSGCACSNLFLTARIYPTLATLLIDIRASWVLPMTTARLQPFVSRSWQRARQPPSRRIRSSLQFVRGTRSHGQLCRK